MNSNNVLFSVIVAAYNSGTYINKCIDSVIGQTCPELELILIDDGSHDDTLAICNGYAEADSRVKVVHKENGGHTSARNEGLSRACGEYVLFLDSDDSLSRTTLEECKSEIVSNHPDIIVFGMLDSDGGKLYRISVNDGCYEGCELEKIKKNGLVMGKDGSFAFPKSLSAKCFRRDVIYEPQMCIPREIKIGEDGAAFVGAMMKASKVSVIAQSTALYCCLKRADSVSRTSDPNAFQRAKSLLYYYHGILCDDYMQQFYRCVVAQLYTAALFVIRSGEKREKIDSELEKVICDPLLSEGLKKASFSLKGYRFIVKKLILRHRLWWAAKRIDG